MNFRSDYQRISEEIRKRGRRPPPLPPGDSRITTASTPQGDRNISRMDGGRLRLDTLVDRPPQLALCAGAESFDVSSFKVSSLQGVLISMDEVLCKHWCPQ